MADNNGIEQDSETDATKPVKEIPVIQDQGVFEHDTGDVYDGFFEAKKKDRSVKMHGQGTYKTAEGDTYTGTWEADRLGVTDDVIISFTDHSTYQGQFREWAYNGHGKYIYQDDSVLKCDFSDSAPIGNLTLLDPNGHTWLGKAEQGYAWFDPINHYYDMLEKSKESKLKKQSNILGSGVLDCTPDRNNTSKFKSVSKVGEQNL